MRIGVIVSLAASAVLGVGALIMAQIATPAGVAQPQRADVRPQGATTPVVVAAGPLAYGAKLEPKDLRVALYPADAAPDGAYASIDALLNGADGPPVVLTPIAQKEPLLPAKLSGPGARPSLAAAISEGKRAYTIAISDVAGVGGHALPGDHADIMLTWELQSEGRAIQSAAGNARAEILLQDVRLLGIDLNADPGSETPALGSTATLEVTVEEAQKLAVAAEAGTLSLVLRRPGTTGLQSARTVTLNDLASARPVRPASARPAPRRSVADTQTSILVIQGSEAAQVRVSRSPGI